MSTEFEHAKDGSASQELPSLKPGDEQRRGLIYSPDLLSAFLNQPAVNAHLESTGGDEPSSAHNLQTFESISHRPVERQELMDEARRVADAILPRFIYMAKRFQTLDSETQSAFMASLAPISGPAIDLFSHLIGSR